MNVVVTVTVVVAVAVAVAALALLTGLTFELKVEFGVSRQCAVA